MAWIQVAVSKKNGATYSKTLLLNSDRFGQVKTFSTTAEFYYKELNGVTVKYVTSTLTRDQLITLITDTTMYDNRVGLDVTALSLVRTLNTGTEDALSATTEINVEADQLVKAWDIDTSNCYALFETGKRHILYKVNSTIDELEGAYSTSVSLI